MNILITGGSSGLGKKIVEVLSEQQNNNIFFTYNTHVADALAIEKSRNNITSIKVDFCNDEDIDNLINNLATINMDVLINNAYVGCPQTTYFHKVEPIDFLDGFKHNIIPTIRITQEAIILFKKKRFGKIINILTDALSNPPMGYSVYASNKAYLLELSKIWNKEYTRYNITSNCVSPAYMRTDFTQLDERFVEQMEQTHPLKKLLTTDEVAKVVAFLVESSQQVNGVNIALNAGQC